MQNFSSVASKTKFFMKLLRGSRMSFSPYTRYQVEGWYIIFQLLYIMYDQYAKFQLCSLSFFMNLLRGSKMSFSPSAWYQVEGWNKLLQLRRIFSFGSFHVNSYTSGQHPLRFWWNLVELLTYMRNQKFQNLRSLRPQSFGLEATYPFFKRLKLPYLLRYRYNFFFYRFITEATFFVKINFL